MLRLIRGFVSVAILGTALVPASASRPSRQSTLPNFIVILADDLDVSESGGGQSTSVQTPNLHRLATEGMRITEAYAGAPVGASARAALLTGQHAGHGRVRSSIQVPLAPEDVTIAEVLRSVGYQNAAVGLWGLGWEGTTGNPKAQGFDEFLGCLDLVHGRDDHPSFLWRNDIAFLLGETRGVRRPNSGPAWFFRGASNFIRISEDRPFFLFYAPNLPGGSTNLGIRGIPTADPSTALPGSTAERARAARLAYLDQQVGLILDDLRRRDLDSDTLVVLTSAPEPNRPQTNGSAGRWRIGGAGLYEGSLRVPFLAWWPGRIQPGSITNLPIAAWDVLPTLADLAKAPRPPGTDGRSFAPTLLGKPGPTNQVSFYWENHTDGYHRAARMGPWKAVQPSGKPMELFDLESDPAEKRDIASENPKVVAEFESWLAANHRPWSPPADGAASAAGRPGIAPPTNMYAFPARTNYPLAKPKRP